MVPFLLAAVASDGSVTFDSNAPASTDFWIGPQRYGAAKVFGTEDAVAGTDTRANGLRYTSEGVIRVYDATSAVPAGSTIIGGFAVTSDGQLCVSTDSVASATFVGGIAVRSDGAVFATGLSTPRSIADAIITALSPAAWYRNATGVTSAGGFASQWDDYSGNSRHLVQATGTNQPAYAAGVFTFDGVDNFMKATFALNQPSTVILVGSQVSWTINETLFDGASGNLMRLYQHLTTPNISMYAGNAVGVNSNLAVGSRAVVAVVFNGASSSMRVNDTAKTTVNAGASNSDGFTLGAYGAGIASWANITAEEAILFPSALSDTNASAVITALNNALTVF